jgi:hypothetical protein
MSIDPPANPLRYDPSVEELEKDEAETTQGLIEQMRKIADITYEDGGHAMRGVHAKSHGILRGELIVLADLPPVLAQGLFATAGSHDVVMRFSTAPGDILPDNVSTPRGLAIKVFDAQGRRLPGSDGATTQDFVMVNGKAFATPKAKAFLANVKLLAGTTDKAEGLKKVLSAALRGAESLVETLGGESATLKSLGGHPETNILGESFFSQAPIRYGDYIAKIGVRPISPGLTALTDAPVDLKDKPDGLRQAVSDHFSDQGGEWEVVVQLRTDAETMPIEDSHKPWPEDSSPYVPVARLVVGPQASWDEARTPKINDALAFSPWHGLAAHQPLGSIMRVRKAVYQASQEFRLTRTGCPLHEPASAAEIG